MLNGIDVILTVKKENGVDGFNRKKYTETEVTVRDVLVTPTSTTDVIDTLNLTGKKAVYTLAIPKGDTHNWKNTKVKFFGKEFMTFGEPIIGIDELVPTKWNMKVMVELYE